MKKEEFNYLYSFKYKGKDYVFLTSKNYPFYFLEYNFKTKNFDYPDIETFKDLFNKFHSTNNILAFNLLNIIPPYITSSFHFYPFKIIFLNIGCIFL